MAMTEQQTPQTDPSDRAPWRIAATIAAIAVAVAVFTIVALAVFGPPFFTGVPHPQ